MKEYWLVDETPKGVSFEELSAPRLSDEDYIKIHRHIPIPCHDVFINYERQGLLFVKRMQYPSINNWSPIGGRMLRGVRIEESLKQLVKRECNLEIGDLVELTPIRNFCNTDPFNHKHGTDNPVFRFLANGSGEIITDAVNIEPMIVSDGDYIKIRQELSDYVRDFADEAYRWIK